MSDIVRFGGAGLGAILVCGGVLWWRDGAYAEAAVKADELHAQYGKLYHPDQPGGLAVADAQQRLRIAAERQHDELLAAERALAPAAEDGRANGELGPAQALVQHDLQAVRTLAERLKIKVPAQLPFQGGLDPDPARRARQVAVSGLARLAVEGCLHAGVAQVDSIQEKEHLASPDGRYAVFAVEIACSANWDAVARLIAGLDIPDGRGLGIRTLALEPSREGGPLVTRVVVTQTLLNQAAWALAAAPVEKPASAGAAAQPAATPAGGSRLRRAPRP